MSDEEYFEQLCSNSIDGTLTEAEREKLEAHLAECPSCAALQQDLEWMQAAFAEEAEPPAGLHDGIMQRLRQESRLEVVQPEKPVRRMPVITMVAAAAVVVLVVLGGGLMPMFFSTVGTGAAGGASTTAEAAATDGAAAGGAMNEAVAADAAEAGVAGSSDGAAAPADNSGAAEGSAYGASADARSSGQASVETYSAEQTAPQEAAGQESTAMESIGPAAAGGSTDTARDVQPSVAPAQSGAQNVEIPETMRAMTVAHCYLAQGGEELPDIGGELLGTDGDTSWFLLNNDLSTIQETLGAVEDAGYAVSSYEGTGITIDSKATSWMLIVTSN